MIGKRSGWRWRILCKGLLVCVFVDLCICVFVYLFNCVFVYLFICLIVYLFICHYSPIFYSALTTRKQPTVPTVVNLDHVQKSEPPQSAQLQCLDRVRVQKSEPPQSAQLQCLDRQKAAYGAYGG